MRVVQNKAHSAEKSSPEPKHPESKDETEDKGDEASEEETEEQEATEVERRAKFTVSGAPARVSTRLFFSLIDTCPECKCK